jgi:hypothetical protein
MSWIGQRKEEDQNKKKGTSGRRNKKENRTEGFSSFPTLLRRVSPGGMCFVNETIERLKNNKEAGEKNCPRRNVFSTKLETKAHRWGESWGKTVLALSFPYVCPEPVLVKYSCL